MTRFKVPDLDELVYQSEVHLKNPVRKVPKRIGFAETDVYMPRYIKRGCEQFIARVEMQLASGSARFVML